MTISVVLALVEVDPADIATAEAMEMDAKDRHVLAAALSADADILLTENRQHFPRDWMTEHGIELLGAGELLVRLAAHFPDEIRAAHARTLRYSPKSQANIFATLERSAGRTSVDAIRRVTTVGSDTEKA